MRFNDDNYFAHRFQGMPEEGCGVMNDTDQSVPFTRLNEHKHFAPWEQHTYSVCYRDFSRNCGAHDIPYYPVHLTDGNDLLARYQARAQAETRVSFVGRLGTYRYMDMDVTIRAAIETSKRYLASIASPVRLAA